MQEDFVFVISLLGIGMRRIDVLLAKSPQEGHSTHRVEVHAHLEGGGAALVVDQGP